MHSYSLNKNNWNVLPPNSYSCSVCTACAVFGFAASLSALPALRCVWVSVTNVCVGVGDECIGAYWLTTLLTKGSFIDIFKSSSTRVACKVIEQRHTVQAICPFLLMSSPSPCSPCQAISIFFCFRNKKFDKHDTNSANTTQTRTCCGRNNQ